MSELMRTLPASWYRSSPLYQLERKAVFMKACRPVDRVFVLADSGSRGICWDP